MTRTTRLCIVVMVCVVAVSGTAQEVASDVIATTPVTEGIYRLELATAWVPQNATVSVGEDGILLVDPGGRSDTTAVEAALAGLGGGDRRVVIDTHGHTDHTAGNGIWGGRALVVAHAAARRELTSGGALLLDLPPQALPTITFDDELTLHFNGEAIRLKHLPGGHSASDVAVIFEGSRVVALGGMVFGDGFPGIGLGDGGTPEKLADNLQWVLDNMPEDSTVITGHGSIYSAHELAAYVDMLRRTTAIVVGALAAGDDADTIKQAGLLAGWSTFDRPFLDVNGWVDAIVASRTPPEPNDRMSLIEPLHHVLQARDAEAAVALYRQLKATAPEEYAFTEGVLNAVGYYLLGKGRVDEAITVFALNVEEYPEGFNTYDSLAEGYMTRGDRELAIRNYTRSLELNPDNTNARDKLAELTRNGPAAVGAKNGR